MADIALRSYFEEIDGLIDGSRVEEAIAHLKHILGIYPKALDAYRLMAKALLEKNRHLDAADVFQRVLSSVPDDFIAHIGMAVVREDEGNIDAAIWHMERAYEVQPSSGPIQEELRRLYGKRDGTEPPRLRLSRAALARMYDKGDLYQQAIGELRVALRDEPDRLDLKVMLASALWRSRQRSEAAETSAKLLEILPYCREANRILADVWTEAGRPEEARNYRRRLEALDPYEAFADASQNGHGAALVASEQVNVPHLDVVYGESAPDASRPDWMEALGIQYDQPASTEQAAPGSEWLSSLAERPAEDQSAAPAQALPGTDWLSTIRGEGLPATGPLTAPSAATGSIAAASADTPDWLSGLGVAAEPKEAAEPQPASASESADWVSDVFGQTGSVPADTPEPRAGTGMTGWLAALAGEPETTPSLAAAEPDVPDWLRAEQAAPSPSAMAAQPAAESGGLVEDSPDWLTTAAHDAGSLTAPQTSINDSEPWSAEMEARRTTPDEPPGDSGTPGQGPAVSADVPDWLQAIGANDPPAMRTETRGSDVPDWLTAATEAKSPAGSGPVDASTSPTPAASQSDVPAIPEWLAGSSAVSLSELPASSTPEAGDLPDWLNVSPAADQSPVAEPPAWLTAEGKAQEESLSNMGPAGLEHAADVPDWLKGASPEPAAAEGQPEPTGAPDWLSVTPDAPAGQPVAENDLPAWLAQTDSADSKPVEPAPSTLDWLQADETPVENAPEDVPSWLNTATPEPSAADLPAWLANAEPETAAPTGSIADQGYTPEAKAAEMARAEEEIPDWMKSAGWSPRDPSVPLDAAAAAVSGPISAETSDNAAPAEMPDWLQALKPSEESRPAARANADAPDWLRQAMEGAPAEQPESATLEAAAPAQPLESADLPDWLKPSGEQTGDMVADGATSASLPDWLESNKLPPSASEEAAVFSTLPDWSQTPGKNPADAVASYLKDQSEPQPVLETNEAKPELSTASPAEMSADEAMAWLESLAAQHGAKEEELVTRGAAQSVSGRPSTAAVETSAVEQAKPASELPAQLLADEPKSGHEPILEGTEVPGPAELGRTGAAEAVSVSEPSDIATPTGEAEPEPAEAEESKPEAFISAPASTASPAAESSPAAMSDDEALAWLEGLAARQGARPEELVSGLPSAENPALEAPQAAETATADEQAFALLDSIPGAPQDQPVLAAGPAPSEPVVTQTDALAGPTAGVPAEPTEMSADQALAWLESLAARQGAAAEELVTAPEARSDAMPGWVRQEAEASPVEADQAMPEPEASSPVLPSELSSDTDQTAITPLEQASQALQHPEMDADQAMAWLESLAARQGAAAEELVTSPESRSETTPEWIAAEAEAAPAIAEAPIESIQAEAVELDSPAADKPAWLAQMEAEADAYEATTQAAPVSVEAESAPGWVTESASEQDSQPGGGIVLATDADDLPGWLKTNPPDEGEPSLPRLVPAWKSAEPPETVEARPDNEAVPMSDEDIPDWLKSPAPGEPEPRIVPAWKPSQAAVDEAPEPESASSSPAPDEELPDWLKPEAAAAEAEMLPTWLETAPVEPPEPVWVPMAEQPAEVAAAAPNVKPAKKPKSPRKQRPSRAKPRQTDETAKLLEKARQHLTSADLDSALQTYGDLVSAGHFNSEIIADLEAANRQQPGHPELLRTLGDAYMRDNQLQKALDAYKRALQQL